MMFCDLTVIVFSWNPAGAIRSGRNPATYRYHGEIIHVNGELSPCRNHTIFNFPVGKYRFLGFSCLFLLSFLHTVYISGIHITIIVSTDSWEIDCQTMFLDL